LISRASFSSYPTSTSAIFLAGWLLVVTDDDNSIEKLFGKLQRTHLFRALKSPVFKKTRNQNLLSIFVQNGHYVA
jgi:hypothetical protein